MNQDEVKRLFDYKEGVMSQVRVLSPAPDMRV